MLNALATIIRRRRLEQNLSPEKFARMLDIDVEFLQTLETGDVDIDVSTLYEIAASLNTSCGELSEQAERLNEDKEFRQYRMRRKLTTLKQIAALQRQHTSLLDQLDRLERQRKDLIAKTSAANEETDSINARRNAVQALEQRLKRVKQQQEEQDRFMQRFLANRAACNTSGEPSPTRLIQYRQ